MKRFSLSDTLEVSSDPCSSTVSLARFDLCILVGVTGVGKTTLKNRLMTQLDLFSLPGRRTLTDQVILPMMQKKSGPSKTVTDRCQRFARTRAFQTAYPGGMGFVLSCIRIKSGKIACPVIFDGLRGLAEVQYAAKALPRAFFILLTAPDPIRIQRLIQRQDPFDRTREHASRPDPDRLPDFPGSADEQTALWAFAQSQGIDAETVQEKTRIVCREKQQYDQEKARAYLTRTAPNRTFIADTDRYRVEEIMAGLLPCLEQHFSLMTA